MSEKKGKVDLNMIVTNSLTIQTQTATTTQIENWKGFRVKKSVLFSATFIKEITQPFSESSLVFASCVVYSKTSFVGYKMGNLRKF